MVTTAYESMLIVNNLKKQSQLTESVTKQKHRVNKSLEVNPSYNKFSGLSLQQLIQALHFNNDSLLEMFH